MACRESIVTYRYALKNAIGPALTVIGLTFAYALTGTFFVEIVFNWPGLGLFTVRSLLNVDYPAIMGITLFGAVGYVLLNLRGRSGAGVDRSAHQPAMKPGIMTTITTSASAAAEPISSSRRTARHVLRDPARDPLALVSLIVIIAFIFIAVFAYQVAPYPLQGAGKANVSAALEAPSWRTPSAPTAWAATCSAA